MSAGQILMLVFVGVIGAFVLTILSLWLFCGFAKLPWHDSTGGDE